MHLLYDHQIFTQQKYGGISRYFCELLSRFSMEPEIQLTLALRYSGNENLLNRPELDHYWSRRSNFLSNQIFPFLHQTLHRDILTWLENRRRINQKESVRLLNKQEFDLFHPTYYDPYFLKPLNKKPFVLTVYDMIHELYPGCFSPRDPVRTWKIQLLKEADAIIAISENTKEDILRCADIDPGLISVVYLGNPLDRTQPLTKENTHEWRLFLEKRYLLFVGTRTGYKNFNFFIQSVTSLLKTDESLQIYCAGGGPFTIAEKNTLRKLNLLSKVHYIPPDDMLMKSLYQSAQAFVFPSLYEGFGLPVLEAFSCGCPTILCNTSSLPEIAADAACYFDPTDPESLIECIETILSDRNYREELIRKGYERLKIFSWEKTAKETRRVYDNVLYQ